MLNLIYCGRSHKIKIMNLMNTGELKGSTMLETKNERDKP